MTSDPAGKERRPEFSAERLLLVVSGAVGAIHVPYWLTWLRSSYSRLEVRVVLTPGAERFVTPQALTSLSGQPVMRDRWPDGPVVAAPHVELAEWAEAVAVYPASLHYLSRVALGLADTPSVLALQCTSAAVAFAPSLPPGVEELAVYQGHLEALRQRPNVVVAPTVTGRSVTTGRADVRGAPPLWTVLALLEQKLQA